MSAGFSTPMSDTSQIAIRIPVALVDQGKDAATAATMMSLNRRRSVSPILLIENVIARPVQVSARYSGPNVPPEAGRSRIHGRPQQGIPALQSREGLLYARP